MPEFSNLSILRIYHYLTLKSVISVEINSKMTVLLDVMSGNPALPLQVSLRPSASETSSKSEPTAHMNGHGGRFITPATLPQSAARSFGIGKGCLKVMFYLYFFGVSILLFLLGLFRTHASTRLVIDYQFQRAQ